MSGSYTFNVSNPIILRRNWRCAKDLVVLGFTTLSNNISFEMRLKWSVHGNPSEAGLTTSISARLVPVLCHDDVSTQISRPAHDVWKDAKLF